MHGDLYSLAVSSVFEGTFDRNGEDLLDTLTRELYAGAQSSILQKKDPRRIRPSALDLSGATTGRYKLDLPTYRGYVGQTCWASTPAYVGCSLHVTRVLVMTYQSW